MLRIFPRSIFTALLVILAFFSEGKSLQTLEGDPLYNAIISKYQPQNLPALAEDPTVDQAISWARQLMTLIKTSRIEDSEYITQAIADNRLSPAHASRFDKQINNQWFDQRIAQIQQLYIQVETQVAQASGIAPVISQLDANTASAVLGVEGSPLANAGKVLTDAIKAVKIAAELDELTGVENKAAREQQLTAFIQASEHFSQLTGYSPEPANDSHPAPSENKAPPSAETSSDMGYAVRDYPLSSKRNNPNSLHIYLNGSKYCEITSKGEVWFGGTSGGWIENDGDIYLRSDFIGSFEEDGMVWSRGSSMGTLQTDGIVWSDSRKVARFNTDGKIEMGGGDYGHLEGKGDWRKAAIVLFFPFYNDVQKY